jgi:putative ABC transport system permease protein
MYRFVQQIKVSITLCLLELWSNKMRTIITSFGIFLGVVSYLVNVAFLRGIEEDIKNNMEEIGGLSILTIRKKTASTDEEKIALSTSQGIRLNEIDTIVKEIPYIKSTLPKADLEWEMIKANGKNTYTKPIAASPEYLDAFNYDVEKGRTFTSNDYSTKINVCLIGKRIVESLFGDDSNCVGKTVTIFNQTFTITGIIKTEDSYSWKSVQFIFPYSLYTYRFGQKNNSVDEIAIELVSSDYVEKAIVDITRKLKQIHRGIMDFEIEANLAKLEELRAASSGIKILLSVISMITLCIGGISIMNIMFAALGDRIREIGIRKAMGARRVDLFFQFIIEAIIVSLVGGIPGIVLGSSIVFFPKGFFPYVPLLTAQDFIIALCFTMICGIVAGFTPALRAANMQPVEALRY